LFKVVNIEHQPIGLFLFESRNDSPANHLLFIAADNIQLF